MTILAPFRQRAFLAIWIANLFSTLGTMIQAVGAAWLMALISDSANAVALVQTASNLPVMLFSVLAGAIADNFSRRKVMLVSQSFMLAASAALAGLAYMGLITPPLLLLFVFLVGCGTALHNPSWFASVGDMVPRESIPPAVALNSIQNNLGRSLGPTLGGAIVATAGAAAAFAVNTLSYFGLILVLWWWRPTIAERTLPREQIRAAVVAGIRYVSMSPDVWRVLLRGLILGFTAISIMALLPLVARDVLKGDALLYGFLFSGFGLGAVVGGLSIVTIRRLLSAEWIERLAFLSMAMTVTVAALSPYAALTFAALVLGGAWWVIGFSLCNVTVQLSTPRWIVGRALSLYHTCSFGGMAVGSWFWGMAAEAQGTPTALVLSAIAMLGGAAIGLGKLRMPDGTVQDLDPLNHWIKPQLGIDPAAERGPVRIQVEYSIAAADTQTFLNLMAERRRIRRRDGAQHWSLSQDLERPDFWIETYQFPTWTEYVRHGSRTTNADGVIRDRIRNLHRGQDRPVVRRIINRKAGKYVFSQQADEMTN